MTIKKHIRFIVNPVSGVFKKHNLAEQIKQKLDSNIYHHDIVYTENAGHATFLATEALKAGAEIVVAVGGDGSVNEVGKALIGTEGVLGILPLGSGNGLAMHLGLGRGPEKALSILNKGKIKIIDTCTLNDRPYLNLAGLGFDGFVAHQSKLDKSRGFFLYLKKGISNAFSYQPKKYTIKINGKVLERQCLFIEVANAPMFGYGFNIVPSAKYDDGLLEILIFNKYPKWRYVISGWRFLNNSIHHSKMTEHFQAKEITITTHEKDAGHFDGEGFETKPGEFHFKIVPRSLKVIVPDIL